MSGKSTPRKRGRPPIRKMPDPIPASPEDVALAIMQGPPKTDWEFLKPGGDGYKPAPDKS